MGIRFPEYLIRDFSLGLPSSAGDVVFVSSFMCVLLFRRIAGFGIERDAREPRFIAQMPVDDRPGHKTKPRQHAAAHEHAEKNRHRRAVDAAVKTRPDHRRASMSKIS